MWRCRPGRPRDPSFTGRLSPTSPLSGGSRGIEPPWPFRDHVWRGLLFPGGGGHCARSRGVWAAGACAVIMGFALILAVPGGGTGPGASRLRRTPSAIRGGQLGIGDLVGLCLKAFGGGLCGPLLDCCRGLGVWPCLFPWAPYSLPFRFSLARLMAFWGALFTVEIAPRKVDPLRPLARSGAA